MKNKVMKNILMIMLSSTILMGSASVTAFAQANENAEQAETAEQVIKEQPAEQPAAEGTPFSTSGNGQLVDDKENDSSKQFLTVQTKNGNTPLKTKETIQGKTTGKCRVITFRRTTSQS